MFFNDRIMVRINDEIMNKIKAIMKSDKKYESESMVIRAAIIRLYNKEVNKNG
jgi:Arc/MetJ-type ribon-helix-helix transcriptional regulator